jgi:hypothetical protein
MDAERGRRADALFHAALPLGIAERRAFLDAACADDLDLAAEISDRLASAHPSEPVRPTAADSRSEQTSPGVPREVSTGPLSAATQWGGLRLIAPLGRGGFGRVYRAWDEGLAREVALKIIPVRQPGRADLLREGQMLARVRHPNVVVVHAVQQINNEVGLTMELIEGRTLAEDVRQNGPRGADEAATIGIRVCQALAAVHGVRLLHRDVKAQNVMREAGGRIVLMDFGAGRDVDGTGRHHEVVGTPLYLAPELLTGGLATPASDLYSVGVLMFYLVTGKYPLEGASLLDVIEMHRQGKRRRLADLRPDLPPRFVRVVERALATTPDQRYQSAGEMITDLADAIEPAAAATRRADAAAADSDAIAHPTTAPATLVLRVLLGLLAVPLLGALTCAQYDRMIARTAEFTTEGPSDWTYWGFKALQTPAIYVTMLAFLVWATGTLWHLLQRLAPPLGRANERARSLLLRSTSRLTGANPAGTAEMLLAFQVICVVFGIVVFYKLIFAMMLTVEAQYPAWLDVLDPNSHLLLSYRVTLTSMLAVMAVGWFRLLRPPAWRASIPRPTIAAGVATMVLFLLAISVPYRAFYKSEAPQITYRGRPCFQTGISADKQRTLLYCPGATTAVLTTTMDDRDLNLTGGTMKRIFSRDLTAAKQ